MSAKETHSSAKHGKAQQLAVDDDALSGDVISAGIQAVRDGMSEKEFEAKFSDAMREPVDKKRTIGRMSRPLQRQASSGVPDRAKEAEDCKLFSIVLKVTTLSEETADAPSFLVGTTGARIGRGQENEVCISADSKMAVLAHSCITFTDGSFFIEDKGNDNSTALRLIPNRKQWSLESGARFAAGSSVFKSCGVNSEGSLLIEIVGGPLKGERRFVTKKGITVGRSGDNGIALPDKELSRKHSKIVFDDATGKYYVCDVGSTNGTYMQLVGPYGMKYRLNLNDNILVGRTGFSVNRYEIGISEDIGTRATMEDSVAIYQYLRIPGISHANVTPISFFAVYDGHGGGEASVYLSHHLHVNVVERLAAAAEEIQDAALILDEATLDRLVTAAMREAFLRTDQLYLANSANAEPGSTATTVLMMGQRIYCANVGDSRTVLCRDFSIEPLSSDHKPTRPDEAKRIKDAGGYIIGNRVMGELAVSRAFGDSNYKKSVRDIMAGSPRHSFEAQEEDKQEEKYDDAPLVIAEPEFEIRTIIGNHQFLLLACDGLFDVFIEEGDLVQFVKSHYEKYNDAQRVCQALSHEAIKKRGSKDNVSIILIVLNPWASKC